LIYLEHGNVIVIIYFAEDAYLFFIHIFLASAWENAEKRENNEK